MNFLIDLGNTRLKWACCENNQIVSSGASKYDTASLPSCFSKEWGSIVKPAAICMASDTGTNRINALKHWVDMHWGTQVHVISPKNMAYGVKNAYKNPEQLGSDRWATLVAAKSNIKQAAIIVDCGTAITIDAITAAGVHQGGMILPGIELMQCSLMAGTHRIEEIVGRDTHNGKGVSLAALASNTLEGIRSGVFTAAVAYINDTVARVKSKLETHSSSEPLTENQKRKMQITNIITGGDADMLLPFLDESFVHKPHLVLEGLAIILDDLR